MRIAKTASNFAARAAAAGVLSIALVAMPAASAVASPSAHAAKVKTTFGIVNAKGGTAALTIDPAVVSGAASYGVTIAPTAPATAVGNVWSFPVQRGRILWVTRTKKDNTSVTRLVQGHVELNGGFTAVKDGKTATITNLKVDVAQGQNGKVQARVNGSRPIEMFVLSAPVVDSTTHSVTATVGITARSAGLLNKALKTTTFKARQTLGTVVVTPAPAPVV